MESPRPPRRMDDDVDVRDSLVSSVPDARVVPPGSPEPHPLRDEVRALFDALRPVLPSLANHHVALLHLPPLLCLAVFHLFSSCSILPVFLNSRWARSELVPVFSALPIRCVLTVPSAPLDGSSWPAAHPPLLRLRRHSHPRPRYSLQSPIPAFPSATPPSSPHPDAAAVFFTSGTTGLPKPITLTHTNLLIQSRVKHHHLSLSSASVYLHLSPLYHVGGFSAAHAITQLRATHVFPDPVLHPSTRTHLPLLLSRLSETSVTFLSAVPSVYALLVSHPSNTVYPSVRTLLYGGARLPNNLLTPLHKAFSNARLFGAYGMTEAASSITFLPHHLLHHSSPLRNSVGFPHSQIALRVVNNVLHLKGPSLSPTVSPTQDHWFNTGDLASIHPETSAVFLHGRSSQDVIRSAGETVLAPEVELCLLHHPNVADAAVVGLPHPVLGHAVAAAVQLLPVAPPLPLVLHRLSEACTTLAKYKRPKWIVPLPEIPRNSSGKVSKSDLIHILQRRLQHSAPALLPPQHARL